MAIFVTGDTHGSDGMRFRPERFESYERELGRSLNKDDYMIIAGDFGVIWDTGHKDLIRYEDSILDYFDALPWTTLFLDGNHENFPRLLAFPEEQRLGGTVDVLRPSLLHLKTSGHVYIIDDNKIWCFGGGTSVDKNWRTPGVSWWAEEEPTDKEYMYGIQQAAEYRWQVDYVVTHAAPREAVDALKLPPLIKSFGENVFEKDRMPEYFQFISQKLQREHWYFGHYHEDKLNFNVQTRSALMVQHTYSAIQHEIVCMC